MVDFTKDSRILLRPGYTDMRLGIMGLSKLIGRPDPNCAYVFCGSRGRTVKIIEFTGQSIWLHIKKAPSGLKFAWPMQGSDQQVDPATLKLLIDSIDEVSRLEADGKQRRVIMY